MIIGISGKIGSGKDTIGRIIQVLCYLEKIRIPYSFSAYQHNVDKFIHESWYGSWQIKKFAYKLKQIVSLLTGCTIEDLEKQEFKDSTLSREWQDYSKEPKTYRWLMQTLATEGIRNIIHQNTWINALFADYVHSKEINNTFGIYPNWIITDLRFTNELEAIEERNGIVIRVNRSFMRGQDHTQEHPSETALDHINFTHTIDNNGTMEELVLKVKKILIQEGILSK